MKTYRLLLALILLCSGTVLYAPAKAKEETDSVQELKSETVKLPEPKYESDVSVEEALLKRRSARSFTDSPMTIAEVSQLLWAAQGITSPKGFRTAPSAGALYPLEVYIAAGNVDGLPDGVYHYRPHTHELAMTVKGDKRDVLCKAALGQASVRNAAAVILFSAVYERTFKKYGDRAMQYVYMETGHAAQNVFLEAVALELRTVVIGAFYDDEVRKALQMPPSENPLYIMPVGRTR